MTAELICIPTNDVPDEEIKQCSQYLKKELFDMGIDIGENPSYANDRESLRLLLEGSKQNSNIVFTIGSLDPAYGGFALDVISDTLGIPLEEHTSASGKYLLPKRCVVFHSKSNSYPGCAFAAGSQLIVSFPARFSKFVHMFDNHAKQFLEKFSPGTVSTHIVELNGISAEEAIAKMGDLVQSKNPEIRIKENGRNLSLILTAKASTRSQGKQLIEPMREKLNSIFAEEIKSDAPQSVQQAVVELLMRKSLTIATAESCTAGLISKCLTEIPGSSSVFLCGVAAYTGEIKHNILGVKRSTLEKYGEVSPETAAAMAIGARKISGSSIGIGVTGIAGPGGGTPEKPVGLVYFALADSGRVWIKKLQAAPGRGRDYIRTLSANSTLELVRLYLASLPEILEGSISLTSYKTNPEFLNAVNIEEGNDKSNDANVEKVVVDFNKYYDEEDLRTAKAAQQSGLVVSSSNTGIQNKDSYTDLDSLRYDDNYDDFSDEYDDKRHKRLGRLVAFLITVFILLILSIVALLMMPQIQQWVAINSTSAVNEELFVAPDESIFAGYSDADIKAVMAIPNTDISYPIVYNENPGYYSTDYQSDNEGMMYFYYKTFNPSTDKMTLILGNSDDFANYEDISYLREHPTIQMDTRDRKGTFSIFAVGYMDQYALRKPFRESASTDLSMSFIEELYMRTLYQTGSEVASNDSIIVIAVDSDKYDSQMLFIAARRMWSLDSAPALDSITENRNALLPDETSDAQSVNNEVTSVPVSSEEPLSELSSEPSSEPSSESSEEDESSSRRPSSSSRRPTSSRVSSRPSSRPSSSSSNRPSSSSSAPSSTPSEPSSESPVTSLPISIEPVPED